MFHLHIYGSLVFIMLAHHEWSRQYETSWLGSAAWAVVPWLLYFAGRFDGWHAGATHVANSWKRMNERLNA